MAALFFLISALLALIYFGIIRRLNEKWLEIAHFSALYLLLQVPILIVILFIARGTHYENFNNDIHTMAALFVTGFILPILFYVPSSFVVSYLLYPFKVVKRSKVLIWVLSIISVLATGVVTLVEIAHAFSNM